MTSSITRQHAHSCWYVLTLFCGVYVYLRSGTTILYTTLKHIHLYIYKQLKGYDKKKWNTRVVRLFELCSFLFTIAHSLVFSRCPYIFNLKKINKHNFVFQIKNVWYFTIHTLIFYWLNILYHHWIDHLKTCVRMDLSSLYSDVSPILLHRVVHLSHKYSLHLQQQTTNRVYIALWKKSWNSDGQ